jgi:hypothetical protein
MNTEYFRTAKKDDGKLKGLNEEDLRNILSSYDKTSKSKLID